MGAKHARLQVPEVWARMDSTVCGWPSLLPPLQKRAVASRTPPPATVERSPRCSSQGASSARAPHCPSVRRGGAGADGLRALRRSAD